MACFSSQEAPALLLNEFIQKYPALSGCRQQIADSYDILQNSFSQGGKLLIAGNGGSASDSSHIVGELMKGFLRRRPLDESQKTAFSNLSDGQQLSSSLQQSLPAIALTEQSALLSAIANDISPELVFAQQVFGYGCPHDVFWGLSTSGNSRNIVLAAQTARARHLKTIAITGSKVSHLSDLCDVCIRVPFTSTPRIQEATLPIYHVLCSMLEAHFFAKEAC